MGPLLPDDGSLTSRVVRRGRGIAVGIVLFVLVTVLFPLLLAVAAVVDLVLWLTSRKPWMAVRLLCLLWWFAFGEMRALIILIAIVVASGGRDTRTRRFRVYRLRQYWMGGHIDGVRRVFGLTFEIEGLEEVAPGPVLIFKRHASIIDNALPDAIVGRTHDLGLRFVLKRELAMFPLIDMGGRMVPTNFVRRGSGDTERELADLVKLAIELDPQEGILLYPEGTRFTAKKLARAQEIIAERLPEVAPLANRLNHLLPPRLGGALALLENTRPHDVVFCGHVGLDGFEYFSDIWGGGLVGGTVRIRYWRQDGTTVPTDREGQIAWLYEHWQEMDDWVGEQLALGGGVTLSPKAASAATGS